MTRGIFWICGDITFFYKIKIKGLSKIQKKSQISGVKNRTDHHIHDITMVDFINRGNK